MRAATSDRRPRRDGQRPRSSAARSRPRAPAPSALRGRRASGACCACRWQAPPARRAGTPGASPGCARNPGTDRRSRPIGLSAESPGRSRASPVHRSPPAASPPRTRSRRCDASGGSSRPAPPEAGPSPPRERQVPQMSAVRFWLSARSSPAKPHSSAPRASSTVRPGTAKPCSQTSISEDHPPSAWRSAQASQHARSHIRSGHYGPVAADPSLAMTISSSIEELRKDGSG